MKPVGYTFNSKVWLYPGYAAWHFITIPIDISTDINQKYGDLKRGWSSLPVTVTLGKTMWATSIFFDKKSNSFLLPLKSAVRKKEKIVVDQSVTLTLAIKV
jgi:hypothetical protein